MAREKYSYAQQICIRSVGKTMQSTGMLFPKAKIGVAVSGGMDSWALLKVLKIRQSIVPFSFEITALHVNPGFDPENHRPLLEWLKANRVSGVVELTDHGPRAHSGENRKKSPCFYCAMLRRKRLFQMCRENRLTHLAFGHNADDLVSNFFMNLLQNGRVDGMGMNEEFFGGALRVIRPLMLTEKTYIAKAVKQWGLPIWSNPCPAAGNTKRTVIFDEIMTLCTDKKWMRKNIFNGISRWQHEQNKTPESEKGEGF